MDVDTIERISSGDYYPLEARQILLEGEIIYDRSVRRKSYIYIELESET